MGCQHKRLRCTNGVFYCLDCGAKIDPPKPGKTVAVAKETASERPKRRTAKKGDAKG